VRGTIRRCGRRAVLLRSALAILATAITPPAMAAVPPPEPAPVNTLADDRVRLAPEPRRIAKFELTDQASRPFTSDDLLGNTTLVFFGFTNCRNVCPATIPRLRQVARALEDEPTPFRNVLISVDGERDTPEAMARYLAPYSPGFIGLTGTPEVVRNLATDFSAVFFKGMPIDAKGGYDVEHTPQVYLVDRKGRLRATFYSASIEAMVDTSRRVMREK
jgi:protein SCO1/2